MRVAGSTLRLSASDLACQVSCEHLVQLERAAAEGRLAREYRDDPALEALEQRGLRFEREYVEQLRGEGRDVVELRDFEGQDAVERTRAAMRDGAGVIVQAALSDGRWFGRADLLLRVDPASDLGGWSYEPCDTKLARKTRGATVLQLCLYADLVACLQGRRPERMSVARPDGEGRPVVETLRFDDFGAYYRRVRSRLARAVDGPPRADTYPHPVPHCEICAWAPRCDKERHDDDHLSLVAGLQTLHRVELEGRGLTTLAAFARHPEPLGTAPRRGSRETYRRLHEQSRVQLRARDTGVPVHELLPFLPGLGFARLPEPDPGDVFFDLEANAFVEGGGLEYLFGWAWRDAGGALAYRGMWAHDHAAERRVFETFLDDVVERWRAFPRMHVYHFGVYEPGAIKRLMGRHVTREDVVDGLLRSGRFVDLHAVTRQGLLAGVERYSLKDLESCFGFTRQIELQVARRARQRVDLALELRESIDAADRSTVERYNEDDCRSTAALRGWLEERRAELIASGVEVERPQAKSGDPSERVEARDERTRDAFDRLVADLPADRESWDAGHHARWLLAHVLGYHRREDKCSWWEYFRLQDLEIEELRGERKAVVDLRFTGATGGTVRRPHHAYEFPPQEVGVEEGDGLHVAGDPDGKAIGDVVSIDAVNRRLVVQKQRWAFDLHPQAVVATKRIPTEPLPAALLRLAFSVIEHGIEGSGSCGAARELLLRRPPRFRHGDAPAGSALRRDHEDPTDAAVRIVGDLDRSVLAIQGPPGCGKTTAGARMIVRLARAGLRVGVTAVSHKVIRNLLEKTLAVAGEERLRVAHKVGSPSDDPKPGIEEVSTNAAAFGGLVDGKIVGGTAWLWANEGAVGSLDYLFVDEAGQMSLATLLAAAGAAQNLVLLGDPQQLEQPQQGTHPEGAGRSALEHLLGGKQTIPDELGLFLDDTWRLHPEVCRFTSEVYYEGRLRSRAGLERQRVGGTGAYDGAGLRFVPVEHAGNQNHSEEEVEEVERIVARLTTADAHWTDEHGVTRPLTKNDIRVVAPYNAQVGALARRLGKDVGVGTVDKFQGQEAAVVIYSMTCSSIDDAPRGMSFLFSPNRLNVATSRARGVCILVASPALLKPDCRSPEQMRWANGVCRFVELATEER